MKASAVLERQEAPSVTGTPHTHAYRPGACVSIFRIFLSVFLFRDRKTSRTALQLLRSFLSPLFLLWSCFAVPIACACPHTHTHTHVPWCRERRERERPVVPVPSSASPPAVRCPPPAPSAGDRRPAAGRVRAGPGHNQAGPRETAVHYPPRYGRWRMCGRGKGVS